MFGALMIGGMIAGAVTSSVNDSFANVESTCKSLETAKKHLASMTAEWKSTIATEKAADEKLNNFKESLIEQAQMISGTSKQMKQAYNDKKKADLIGFAVTFFLLIIILVIKRLKLLNI